MATTRALRLHRTIWYMGAKSRVIPGFLDKVLKEELDDGATVVDLMSGSGVVSAFCADRYRVFSNDVQAYSGVIARSLIEHSSDEKEAFLLALEPGNDLGGAFERNVSLLTRRYAAALREEDALLREFEEKGGDGDWAQRYRVYLERFTRLFPGEPVDEAVAIGSGVAKLLSPRETGRRRRDPSVRPASLVTTYYGNVYFGLRQSIEIDSIRAAIDDLDRDLSWHEKRVLHYLSALLHVVSVSTSGTSHFAQPRHLKKDTELQAMARRRLIDVRALFEEYCESISETVRATSYVDGNRVFGGDYRRLIGDDGSFSFSEDVDLVYLDPPYTADNYSRFYHVLEVVARYDYPELQRDGDGRILRGRYPVRTERFQSGFCRAGGVEDEFRLLAGACAKSGAKLVISYSCPTGLLLKQYARAGAADPVARFRDLCKESFRRVHVKRRPLMHSGQGDSNLAIEELLLVCSP